MEESQNPRDHLPLEGARLAWTLLLEGLLWGCLLWGAVLLVDSPRWGLLLLCPALVSILMLPSWAKYPPLP